MKSKKPNLKNYSNWQLADHLAQTRAQARTVADLDSSIPELRLHERSHRRLIGSEFINELVKAKFKFLNLLTKYEYKLDDLEQNINDEFRDRGR